MKDIFKTEIISSTEEDMAAFEDDVRLEPEQEPKLRPCPFCQELGLSLAQIPVAGCSPDYAVECETCNGRGPVTSVPALALQYYKEGIRFMHGSDESPKSKKRRRGAGISINLPD